MNRIYFKCTVFHPTCSQQTGWWKDFSLNLTVLESFTFIFLSLVCLRRKLPSGLASLLYCFSFGFIFLQRQLRWSSTWSSRARTREVCTPSLPFNSLLSIHFLRSVTYLVKATVTVLARLFSDVFAFLRLGNLDPELGLH